MTRAEAWLARAGGGWAAAWLALAAGALVLAALCKAGSLVSCSGMKIREGCG